MDFKTKDVGMSGDYEYYHIHRIIKFYKCTTYHEVWNNLSGLNALSKLLV